MTHKRVIQQLYRRLVEIAQALKGCDQRKGITDKEADLLNERNMAKMQIAQELKRCKE